jgi:CxxC motif-containing protein (DUF1111 family)
MRLKHTATKFGLAFAALAGTVALAQVDPGLRPGLGAGPGSALPGLTGSENQMFLTGRTAFNEVEQVANGLGPRYNLDSCGGCHSQPATGGSSPVLNPQIAAATRAGANNKIPPFITANGPVRVVRFRQSQTRQRDGGVHSLFVISGRNDAPGCRITQEDFSNVGNLTFRIPTPVFGAGLIEAIPEAAILANLAANGPIKQQLGIRGKVNRNGNDGTITRFGWKAQNKSLMVFTGEAYNVEMGVTNELFQNEREEDMACAANGTPEDHTNYDTGEASDLVKFSAFMRFLDAPAPGPSSPSVNNGRNVFGQVGCALCHTPSLKTGKSSTAALSNKQVALYSDLSLHAMSPQLDDQIVQGNANTNEFRTAPLWGLGQRTFFLHDGRSSNLMDAIMQHGGPGSEAGQVVQQYNGLPPNQKQDLINFLRSL